MWILTVPLSPGTGDLAPPAVGAAPAWGPANASVKTMAASVAQMKTMSLVGQVMLVIKKPLVLESHEDTKETSQTRQPLHRPLGPPADAADCHPRNCARPATLRALGASQSSPENRSHAAC